MTNNHLIVFVKNPMLGQVKTRLAETVGDDLALIIYKYLVQTTINVCQNLDCQKYVFYSHFIPMEDTQVKANFLTFIQNGSDIGDRMDHAFNNIVGLNHQNCLLIGSDCPYITQEIITQSFEALKYVDIVIGPAVDGGYYLIGMKKPHPILFQNIEWSSPNVLIQTLKSIRNSQLSYTLMPILSDIDTEQDWNNYVSFKGNEILPF